MEFWKKSMVPTKKRTVIIFLLSIILMFTTYIVTQSMVMRIELHDFTASIQKETRENLTAARNLLDGMVADLDNTAMEIQEYDDLWSEEVKEVLKFSHKMNLFDATFVADTRGNAYDATGYEFNIANQQYFLDTMEKGQVVFSEVLPSQRFGSIQIIAYPLFTEEGEQSGVLFGLFSMENFSHLINSVIDKENRIYILDSNGTYINCFDEEHSEIDHENFWDELESRRLKNITIPELKEDFRQGKEGGLFYADLDRDTTRYGYHMPLGIQDWQIVMTVEETVVDTHIRSIRHVDAIDLTMDIICLTTMLACIYVYFKRANREIVAVNQEISKNNEMLRMAVDHSNQIIFEYDMGRKEIVLKTEIPDSPFESSILSHVPDCFFAANIIPDGSAAALKNLFETIEHEKSSQADVQLVNCGRDNLWCRVRMNNLYDQKGDIISTVGSVENISMLKKAEIAIKRRDEMYKSFMANALVYGRVNLKTGMVKEINDREVRIPYTQYLKKMIDEYIVDEQQSYVAQALSLEKLMEDYAQGKESIEVQGLIKSPQGPRWVSCLVYRVHLSDSAKVTFLIRDIDGKKRQEIALKEQAERDGLTGLYNAATTRSKIDEFLCSKQASQGNHIFILFDLDNFKKINDTFGHSSGDQALIDVASVLSTRFRSSDIIGRLGGDEFVIMLFNVNSNQYIENLMENLLTALTKTYRKGDQSVRLSASMGTALAPSDGTTFNDLYQKADEALYRVKKEGKNGYRRYE